MVPSGIRASFVRKQQAILWKDLLSELRSKELILSMCLFSFLVVIIFSFAFGTDLQVYNGIIPGILWVAFIFSGLLGLNRSFGIERDKGTLSGLLLCPVAPWEIFLAKMIGTLIFTTIMEIFTLLVFIILYNQNVLPFLVPLSLVIFLGTLGFSIVGTIFSAMSSATKARDVILSILVFPISVPVIIASVKATGLILDGRSIQTVYAWLKILVAFDMVFLLLAYLTFSHIMEE